MKINHYTSYRLEIHATESCMWHAEIYQDGTYNALWCSSNYGLMEDAYHAGRYVWRQLAKQDREASAAQRMAINGDSE